ncbi:MAG: hypothetical protein AAFX39_07400 [Pseudomonadota bacterium]
MEAVQIPPISPLRMRTLRIVHEYMIEPFMGRREIVSTGGFEEIGDLGVISDNFEADYHYGPTPRLMIRWIVEAIPKPHEAWTFVDIGSGRGRVLMEAVSYPFRRVIGIEFARELHADADTNLAALPSKTIRAGAVDNRLADATAFSVPAGPCVFYLANTLGGDLLRRFRDHVLTAHEATDTAMIFFYMNPESPEVFAEDERLEAFTMPPAPRFKLTHLAPYRVVAFRTRAGTV